jgi:hypothetical protein
MWEATHDDETEDMHSIGGGGERAEGVDDHDLADRAAVGRRHGPQLALWVDDHHAAIVHLPQIRHQEPSSLAGAVRAEEQQIALAAVRLPLPESLGAEQIAAERDRPGRVRAARRRRRAKTDKIDGDALVRAMLACKRGEPRVCAMVLVPTPEEENCCLARERKALTNERVRHVNRIKGLLFGQGVSR